MSSAVPVSRGQAPGEIAGLDATGRRRRGVPPMSRLTWAGPVGVLVVAAVARFWALGSPSVLMFDETYYVKDAWTIWHLGYEGSWPDKPDPAFDAGHVNGFTSAASYAAHPPLGKWIIGLGEMVTGGGNAAGWRLSVAVVGVLAVGLLMLVAHRLFANPLVTTLAGGLFAIDNQAIVLSRVGLLDNMVMFFALAGVACIIEDRFFVERRFGAWLLHGGGGTTGWGPVLAWRPWLLGAAVAFGLCSGVKWSGLYFLVAFVLYVMLVDAMLRRRAGIRFWAWAALLRQLPLTLLLTVPVALLSYLACWAGWFVTRGGYDRTYLATRPEERFRGLLAWVPAPLQDLWQWHVSIYQFHIGLDAPHPYAAPAILWPLMARPTSMYYEGSSLGQRGCRFDSCAEAITDLANPLIWYGGMAAAVYLLVRFLRRREWQAGLVLTAFAAGYLPWLAFPRRTIFFFYSIAFEPYLILCLAATIGLMVVRQPDAGDEFQVADARQGLRVRRIVVTVFLAAAVVLALFFYPLATGMQTPYWFWHIHMWSPTWV